MTRPALARGMSLVEMMVAVLLLTLMSVLGWRALDGILRARATLHEQLQQSRSAQLAFAQIEVDCRHLVRSADFNGQATLSTANGQLALLRSVALEGHSDQLQIVVYRNEEGVLRRHTSPAGSDLKVLAAAWQATLQGQDHFDGVTLLTHGGSFELSLWRNGSGWQSGGNPGAPLRLRTRRIVHAPQPDPSALQVLLGSGSPAGTLTHLFLLEAH